MGADLHIDKDAFANASSEINAKCVELRALRRGIESSLEQLRADWDTEAGKKFFQRFDDDLLKNLDDYAKVFEYISGNLSSAAQKYEEVFDAANTVAAAQY